MNIINSPDNTWPSACRIKRRLDFQQCYGFGRRYFSNYFVIFVFNKNSEDINKECSWRVGLAVTKKMGNAVRRNRIKRLLREFFRLHKSMLPCGCDIVAVPKKNIIGMPIDYNLFCCDLEPLIAKIYKKHNQGIV